ncbi:unnamed protein product [Camellia sinensis]
MAAASAAPLALNGVKMATTSQAYLDSNPLRETKLFISDLFRQFYSLGWVSGTGGSISIKVHDHPIPKPHRLLIISPSGVQKERMVPEDMYVVSPIMSILSSPLSKPYPYKPPRCSYCAPLFLKAECYHYLFDAAIKLYQLGLDWSTPNHGLISNSRRAFCGHRNVNTSVKAGSLKSNKEIEPLRRCVVLDIEGTTTPISFVSDVLFPYARDNVGRHLDATYDTAETQDDIKLLRSQNFGELSLAVFILVGVSESCPICFSFAVILQVQDDLEQGIAGAVPIPSDDAGKEEIIPALVANVEAMIKADRKITALKQLQGHIWRTGFQNNELEAVVFDDVPEALEKWHALGIKVYIYSSGSRLAQRLIFGNTNYGDLRKYLCGFFDTIVGNKKETTSYAEISESVGVDRPSEILFVTDVYQEAIAAKAAGLEVIISVRPGNGALPENHGFKTVNSFAEI